jgi:SSS family solute:Na+ symporter
VNILIVGGLLAGMLLVGLAGAKKIDGPAGYFVGNRKAGSLAVTGSLLATILGGSNTLGVAGLGYAKGLAGSWWLLSGSVCLLLFSFWLAAKVRRYGAYTIAEVLGRQYSSNAVRMAASLIICTAWVGIVAGQTSAAGHLLTALWPGRLDLMILVSGIVFTCYTVLGGQYSIIRPTCGSRP